MAETELLALLDTRAPRPFTQRCKTGRAKLHAGKLFDRFVTWFAGSSSVEEQRALLLAWADRRQGTALTVVVPDLAADPHAQDHAVQYLQLFGGNRPPGSV